ncbi:hypothetical protein JCM3774_003453, partial [Rhodotorula dairenensis]
AVAPPRHTYREPPLVERARQKTVGQRSIWESYLVLPWNVRLALWLGIAAFATVGLYAGDYLYPVTESELERALEAEATSTVPKLQGKATYARWSFALTSYFRKTKSWDVVTGARPRPDESASSPATGAEAVPSTTGGATEKNWDELNDAARYDIIATLSEEQLNKVVELGHEATAKQLWDFLARENAPTGDVGKQVLLRQLYDARYVDGTDMDAHLVRMRQLASQLAAVGEPLSDSTFGVYVKGSLPSPSWDTVTFLLDAETLDRETLCNRLVMHAERRKAQEASQPVSFSCRNAAALAAQDRANDQCYNCGERGHHSHDCPRPPTPETLAARKRAKGRRGGDRPAARKAIVQSSDEEGDGLHRTFVLSTRVHDETAALVARTDTEEWILDSGAGRHFTGRRDALQNFVAEPLSIDVADNRTVVSPGYGLATLETPDKKTITLKKVHYLPGAATGLLSVRALGAANVAFDGSQGVGSVSIGNSVLLRTRPRTPYVVDARLVMPTPVSAYSTRDSEGAPLMIWHCRLGHIALSTIIELSKKKAVDGLVLSDTTVEDCESCLVSKSKRSAFRRISTPVKRPLARVFIDLGFVTTPDSQGRSSYLVIVDQYSSARWSFPLAAKDADTVLAVFRDWHVAAEKVADRTLARVRSDNGTEFVNATFRAYFKEHGITHELTAPYTPEQNGQAERMNGTLMSTAKALLHESGFDQSDWPLALAVATYTGNRTVHPRLEGVTPYEAFTGKKPYVGHLRPFGSVAFAHVDRTQRSKLDDTAIRGRLVGYAGQYNYAIRLDSGKIVTTRHATFGRTESPVLDESFVEPPSSKDEALQDVSRAQPPPAPAGPVPPEQGEAAMQVPPPPPDGHEYRLVPVGPNPGRFENIDPANILEGRRTRGHLVLDAGETVFAHLAVVLDDESPSPDDAWEEVPVFVSVAMPETPRTYQQAMDSPFRADWIRAMQNEWDCRAHSSQA